MIKLNFVEENNKRNITQCFILYLDKECSASEKETVCNFSCTHCYYRFSNQKWKTLLEIKQEIDNQFRSGATHVQITGAEPTMYKNIIEVIDHIKAKNILCSVITNGYLISIDSIAKQYKGKVDYFLMSIHGHKKKWDEVANMKGAYEKTLKALNNCYKYNIEVHFNTTILKQNYKDLGAIVNLAMEWNVKRISFICFNPFVSFKSAAGQKQVDKLIVSYDDMMPKLEEAFDLCQANNIDFCMRYFPYCKVPEHMRQYVFNYSTLQFDSNEWNYKYWFPTQFLNAKPMMDNVIKNRGLEGDSIEQKQLHAFGRFFPGFRTNFTESEKCKSCNDYLICDTPHAEQMEKFPNQKFEGTKPPFKKNCKYYINKGEL